MTPTDDDNIDEDPEMFFRSQAHKMRRALRKGDVIPGCEDVVEGFAELFSDLAAEIKVAGPEAGDAMLHDALREILSDDEDEE